jgi:hypothetical protein
MKRSSALRNTLMILVLLSGGWAAGQQVPPETSRWPLSTEVRAGMNLLVIPLAHLDQPRKCHVESFETGQIACSRSLGRKPPVYREEDVAAIILPGFHKNAFFYDLIPATLLGGAITGTVYLVAVSALATAGGAVVAFVLLFDTIYACAIAHDADTPDKLLYLQPNAHLTTSEVHLRIKVATK